MIRAASEVSASLNPHPEWWGPTIDPTKALPTYNAQPINTLDENDRSTDLPVLHQATDNSALTTDNHLQ